MDEVTRLRLRRLVEEDNFDAAVAVLDELGNTRDLHPHELVRRGRYIQLGAGEGWSLEDSERSFELAVELDEDHIPALLQLGWFHFAVQDNARDGLAFFEKALVLIREFDSQAQDGVRQCLEELEKASNAGENSD